MVSEKNRKIYKETMNNNTNMNPGNPKRLPDESSHNRHKTYKPQSIINDSSNPRYDARNAGLPIHLLRTIVFVDANNWYHNVKKLFNPSDVSIVKIANLICNNLKLKLQEIR